MLKLHKKKKNYHSIGKDIQSQRVGVTLTNPDFGFKIDIPAEWEAYSDPETSLIFNASKGISVGSGHGTTLRFAIITANYDRMPVTPKFSELESNEDLVQKAGNAFKYFRGVYSQEVQGDDLIEYYPINTSIDDLTDDNFIRVTIWKDILKDRLQQQNNKKTVEMVVEEDIEIMKTIIKSFRRY